MQSEKAILTGRDSTSQAVSSIIEIGIMNMRPEDFLNLVVLPNMKDWSDDHENIRLCYNAVLTVDALAAHIFWRLREEGDVDVIRMKDDTEYRKFVADSNSEFKLLSDVAKAYKHHILTRPADHKMTSRIVEVRPSEFGELLWGEFLWGGSAQAVLITELGQARGLYNVTKNALGCLVSIMESKDLK